MARPVVAVEHDAGIVQVSGPDAWSFLQSLVSQDLDPLRDGDGAHSLLLAPQGRLVADFRVLRLDDGTAWLDTAPGVAPLLADGLRRFRIRVQVEVDDRSEDFARLVVRGAGSIDAAARALAITVPEDQHAHVRYAGARVVRADWHDVEGVDVVGPHDDVMRAHQALLDRGAVDDRGAVEAMRIERGIPVQGLDIDDRTIPQEAFLERDAVSFTKGCFIGQELACRIDSRGSQAPRYLRRIDLDGDEVPPPGAVVQVDGVDVGVVTSSAHRADGAAVLLAMVKRAVAPPARAELLWEGAHAAGTIVAGASGGTT